MAAWCWSPLLSLELPGVINDAAPDAWGQRVVMRRMLSHQLGDRDPAEVTALTYLLESGSDRAGALDFTTSADHYEPRVHSASLALLLVAADDLQAGRPLDPMLDTALMAGSSIGGARPKATLIDGDRHLIAKFSAVSDSYPVIRAEAAAMELAPRSRGRDGADRAGGGGRP